LRARSCSEPTIGGSTAVPLDRPLVAFLYNPFGPKPLTRLCARLCEANSEVHIYYANPVLMNLMISELGRPSDVFHCDFEVAYFHLRG
jgi:hypothetical protein